MKKSFDKVAVILIHVIYKDRTQFSLKNTKELLKLVKLLKNYFLYTFLYYWKEQIVRILCVYLQ